MVESSEPIDADPRSSATDMSTFPDECEYYALTILADRRGEIYWSCQTHFVGYSDRKPGWEIRTASLMNPGRMAEAWQELGQPWLVVHNIEQLCRFFISGGNALVEKEFAESQLPNVVGPSECMHDGDIRVGGFGFIETEDLTDDAVKRRAPTRKLRMQVLKRDGYRCAICGRRPADYTDVELHVHHMVPWRMGGPTIESNLVTLCEACHTGLDPDFEPQLREIANLPGPANGLDPRSIEFWADLERYRSLVADAQEDLD